MCANIIYSDYIKNGADTILKYYINNLTSKRYFPMVFKYIKIKNILNLPIKI
jgi:hypothetical protein